MSNEFKITLLPKIGLHDRYEVCKQNYKKLVTIRSSDSTTDKKGISDELAGKIEKALLELDKDIALDSDLKFKNEPKSKEKEAYLREINRHLSSDRFTSRLEWIMIVAVLAFFAWLFLSPALKADELGEYWKVDTPNYYIIGLQAGKCYSDHRLAMCEDKDVVFHLYGKARYPVTNSGIILLVFEVDHYSAWDGEADRNGDSHNQSGTFDYAGAGFEVMF